MQGLISPLSFPELIRITKPGGFIMWNIATGYEHYGKDYAKYEYDLLNVCKKIFSQKIMVLQFYA